jgi:hypothetical protein
MATNFKIIKESAKCSEPKHYVMEREYKAESRKVAALEKELKAHEKTDMAHAHPPAVMRQTKSLPHCQICGLTEVLAHW